MSANAASAASNPAAAGRRRAATVAGGTAADAGTRLSLADVERLSADSSPDARADFAARFGRQYDHLLGTGTRSLADTVLGLLVRDVEKKVRRALAEAVAASPNLPPVIVRRLAHDDIAVARPILEQSPVLDDAELEDVARTHARQYALAVAGRERISERLAETLASTGDPDVIRRLLGNAGAQLSARTLLRIARDYAHDRDIQDRLIKRPALPYEVVDRLVTQIGERLEWELVRTRRVDPAEARHLVAVARERTTLGIVARDHGDRSVERELRRRFDAGELEVEDVLRYLRDGEIRHVEAGIALLAGLELPKTRQLLYGFDRRGLAALCLRAAFPTPHYVALRLALDLAEQAVTRARPGPDYAPETLRFIQDQYERMRADKEAMIPWFAE